MGLVALVLFGITLFWIKDLTAPGYVIAAIVFAGMFAVFGMLVPPGRGRHLALPGVWVLAEVWKGHWPFGGVPISDLAIGQVGGPFAGVARLGGSPLLSGVAVAFGVIIAAVATHRDRGTLLGAGAALAALAALLGLAAVAPRGHDIGAPIRFAVVQGGGKQGTQAVFTDTDKVFTRHLKAANTITGPVDVVLWPEDVVDLGDGDIADPDSEKGQALSDLARRLHATVIAGVVENSGDTHFLNYSVAVNPDGTFGGRYEKVHRVPFGEYVPFRSLIAPFAGPGAHGPRRGAGHWAGRHPHRARHVRRGHLVGGVLQLSGPRRGPRRRRGPAEPHQRLDLHPHPRPDPAGRGQPPAGDRDRPVGGAGGADRIQRGGLALGHRRGAHRHLGGEGPACHGVAPNGVHDLHAHRGPPDPGGLGAPGPGGLVAGPAWTGERPARGRRNGRGPA